MIKTRKLFIEKKEEGKVILTFVESCIVLIKLKQNQSHLSFQFNCLPKKKKKQKNLSIQFVHTNTNIINHMKHHFHSNGSRTH